MADIRRDWSGGAAALLMVLAVLSTACSPSTPAPGNGLKDKGPGTKPEVWVEFDVLDEGPIFVEVMASFPPNEPVIDGKRIDHWLVVQDSDGKPVRGRYELHNGVIYFEPAWPLIYDTTYTATLRLPDGRETRASYTTPKAEPKPEDLAPVKVNIEPISPLDPLTVIVSAGVPPKFLHHAINNKGLGLRVAGPDNPPLDGELGVGGAQLTFRPSKPLDWGTNYTAFLKLSDGRTFSTPYITPPQPEGRKPVILNVYPSTDELPANHLKFYISFSEPMRGGSDVFKHFSLLDEAGEAVKSPWQLTELWTPDRGRLTLRIHPGRVKRDISAHEDLGPVLVEGKQFTLAVAPGLKSALGAAMDQEYRRTYKVVAPDREYPVPETWIIEAPTAGTRNPLVIRFGESLDYELARSCIKINNAQHRYFAGSISIGGGERTWTFIPQEPWGQSVYYVSVDSRLEDLAGNRPGLLFDRKASDPAPMMPVLTIGFTPLAP